MKKSLIFHSLIISELPITSPNSQVLSQTRVDNRESAFRHSTPKHRCSWYPSCVGWQLKMQNLWVEIRTIIFCTVHLQRPSNSFIFFIFYFFSVLLAVSEGSYKNRLHCNIGICPPNVMSVLSLSATYPNFPITFPALLKWIKIKQQSLCLVAQLKVTKQESNCSQFGTNLWTPSNFILWQIIHVVNFQLCSIFAFYVMQ